MDLETTITDRVAHVRLGRPQRRNALGLAQLRDLRDAFSALSTDATVAAVVVEALGPVFSAGHDIAEMADAADDAYFDDLFTTCSTLMQTLRSMPQPVVAKVDGVATAAGCQLVAGCDLAVASDRSTFATPGVRIGLFCSTPMVPVSRAVGPKRAMEMLLTGEPIDSATALAWGLINRVVPVDELDAATDALVAQIVRWSPSTIGLGKRAFYRQLDMGERDAYGAMNVVMAGNATMPAAREGMRAFVEKRPPVWPG